MRLTFRGCSTWQVNGFGGIDFNRTDLTADRLTEAIERMRATGVTRCLPTLITSSFERFAASARLLATSTHAAIAGIHMEGPYVSPTDGARGAHPRRAGRSCQRRRLQTTSGCGNGTHRAGHARPGGVRRLAVDRISGRDRRPRRDRSHRGDSAADCATPSRPARRWRRTWATAVRRCCRAIPT